MNQSETTATKQARRPIPFARPCLGPEEEEAAIRVLRSGWLTTAGECAAFEQEFAAFCQVPQALAVNSATAGLHLALDALGIGPDDQVAVSPYTFTASCEVMRYLGAHPAFVDIAPGSFHMDPQALEDRLRQDRRLAKPRIKAIMPVHIGGLGLFTREYREIADRYGLPMVEDAAHALPAREPDGSFLGCNATIGVFSFYANKTITTAEGGMVVCQDPALAKRMKLMRSHGIDREVWARFTTNAAQWRYAVVEAGYKYNMPDLAAAIGRAQLAKADRFMASRRRIAQTYNEAFRHLGWLSLPPQPEGLREDTHSWHLYTLGLQPAGDGGLRDRFLSWLDSRRIGTSVHYIPLHLMPYYRDTYGLKDSDFPQALARYLGAASLPLYPDLGPAELAYIIESVQAFDPLASTVAAPGAGREA